MLIQFSVDNFRSFSDSKILSMESTSISEYPENVSRSQKIKLNICATIYGANASGKSNLIQAIGAMKSIIFNSFDKSSTDKIPYDPFLLNIDKLNQPTSFEVVFLIDNIQYRYGFKFNDKIIKEEWLFFAKKTKEHPLFYRIDDGIEVFKHFEEGVNLESKTRTNALFLTVVDQFNGEISKIIMNWFNKLNVIDGVTHNDYRGITFKMLEDEQTRNSLTKYYQKVGLGFDNIKIKKESFDPNKLMSGIPEDLLKQIMSDLEGSNMISMVSLHKMFNNAGEFVNSMAKFEVRSQESSGTNKIIDLSGPIFHTLKNGGIVIIDELDAKLHPLLTFSIIRLFQNKETNPNSAQLIFATHNTNILSLGRLRRDQIYFCEKDKYGMTDLYSLVEYNMKGKKIRKDNSFEKDYINGKYGAIPSIGSIENLDWKWHEK